MLGHSVDKNEGARIAVGVEGGRRAGLVTPDLSYALGGRMGRKKCEDKIDGMGKRGRTKHGPCSNIFCS